MRNRKIEGLENDIKRSKIRLIECFDRIKLSIPQLKQAQVDLTVSEAMLHDPNLVGKPGSYINDEFDEAYATQNVGERLFSVDDCPEVDPPEDDPEALCTLGLSEYICYSEYTDDTASSLLADELFTSQNKDSIEYVEDVYEGGFTSFIKHYGRMRFLFNDALYTKDGKCEEVSLPDDWEFESFDYNFRHRVTSTCYDIKLKFEDTINEYHCACLDNKVNGDILDKFNEFDIALFYLQHQMPIDICAVDDYNREQFYNFLSFIDDDQKNRLFSYFDVSDFDEFISDYLSDDSIRDRLKEIIDLWKDFEKEIFTYQFFLSRTVSGKKAGDILYKLEKKINRIFKLSYFGILPNYWCASLVFSFVRLYSEKFFNTERIASSVDDENYWNFNCPRYDIVNSIDSDLCPIDYTFKSKSIGFWKNYFTEVNESAFSTSRVPEHMLDSTLNNYNKVYKKLSDAVTDYHTEMENFAPLVEELEREQERWNKLTNTEKTTEFAALEEIRIAEINAHNKKVYYEEQTRISQAKAEAEIEHLETQQWNEIKKDNEEKERLDKLAKAEEEKAKHLGRMADIEEEEFRYRDRKRRGF